MKKRYTILFVLILLFYLPASSIAQTDTLNKKIQHIKIGVGIGHGQKLAFNGFVNFLFKNDVYTGLHFLATSFKPNNLPEDYHTNGPDPYDSQSITTFLIGKELNDKNDNAKFSLEGGVSFVRYNELSFESNRSWVLYRYYTNDNLKIGIGFMVGTKVNFKFSRTVSLDLGLYSNFNSIRFTPIANSSIVFTPF